MLKKLRQATNRHRCDWARGCKKWVKYVYPEKQWYYCKIHASKFVRRNLHKKQGKKAEKNYKRKRRTVTARVLKLRENATWAEKIFKDKMRVACSVKWQFQRGFIKGGYYAIVDFYIPSRKLCIEIDGEYHSDLEQQRKDKHRDNWLRTVRKMRVCRITNEQAIKMSITDVANLIKPTFNNS